MRRERRALSPAERQGLAARLGGTASRYLLQRRARRFACYLANDGEMDLMPLVERLWAANRRTYLPALHGMRLWFLPFSPRTPLANNRFGIPEPDISPVRRCAPRALDVVLMPLVPFDRHGNRLGMGGGFYDATFGYKLRPRALSKPVMVGVAYDFQRVPQLPVQPWDVPLDGVVTESGFHEFDPEDRP